MPNSIIVGTGSYLPKKILTNKDLEKIADTTDQWITERSGIKQRHMAAKDELTSDMAIVASKNAIKSAGIAPDDIDLIVFATTTPDNTFPATATKVQAALGITHGAAFDVQAVCAGFVYALSIADNFIKAGHHKNVLVIGADIMTRITDWEDRGTCILFGDGAGAVILQATDEPNRGILSSHLYSDGSTGDLLYVDGGVSSTGTAGKMRMKGKEVFRHAVAKMAECTAKSLEANNLSVDDVTWMVPHQANIRIIDATAKKLGLAKEKIISTVDMHANTSAASIPLALDVACLDGRIKSGDLVSIQAIGGGLSWGSCLIRW